MSTAQPDPALVKKIEDALAQPIYFRDVLDANRDKPYRAILLAWSEVRTRHPMQRDDYGRYWL